MKKFWIVFSSSALIITASAFAYNSKKGDAKQKEGIAEWPQVQNDSLIQRGKHLVDQMHYSDQDLQAVAEYLRKH